MSIINRHHESGKFFMAFLDTDHLCSRLGSDDTVLKLLRNRDVVVHLFHKQCPYGNDLTHSLGSHFFDTVVSRLYPLLHRPYPTIQWDVCRFATGVQDRSLSSPPTPTVSPLEQVLHYSTFLLSVSHW